MSDSKHFVHSSLREKMMEHCLLSEIMKVLWRQGCYDFEVLHATTDASGYDVVFEARGMMRHIQLKSSYDGAKTAQVNINTALAGKPNGCVVWFFFDAEILEFTRFLWFGAEYGQGMPSLGSRIAKHTKADASGVKKPREGLRVLTKGKFETILSVEELVFRLFDTYNEERS